jgi:hypothetical protein
MNELPIDPRSIPHSAIDEVVRWLGVGYETTVKRKSDGKKIVIRITEEKQNKSEETT